MDDKKTWFLVPDFTLGPGELGLGSIIPHPSRPTEVLASLLSDRSPDVVLPPVRIDSQPNHNHSVGTKRTFNFNLFTNIANIASGKTDINTSRHKTRSFGPLDLEVHSLNGPFPPDTIEKILKIPSVEKHVNNRKWRRRKRPVYIISGLSIAKESFHVREEIGTGHSGSMAASGTISTGSIPLGTGGGIGGGGENNQTHEYYTAAGVIFSFRCHVIQPKGQFQLFASTGGFYSGSGDEDEAEAEAEVELEMQAATGHIVKMDLYEKVEFIEEDIDGDAWIIFHGKKK
ncbi:hypothetical protein N8I77_005002 [Diaporthe amygdali]|uniref:Uncharacterized protein n=1 Tax=Phomopsis amygdali TaxID=1214568 RepID=A0AAD9SM83_PHOAM|nr:hypothetical protein N8I77_005002 [Diaporthe amygdali]